MISPTDVYLSEDAIILVAKKISHYLRKNIRCDCECPAQGIYCQDLQINKQLCTDRWIAFIKYIMYEPTKGETNGTE